MANGDAYTTGEDTPLAIASPGVLANDTNLWDGGITLSVVGVPVGGTVVLNSDGSFIFTPAADFNGAASFVYQLPDADGDASTATVGINVLPANDAPAGTSNTVTVNEDSTRAPSPRRTSATPTATAIRSLRCGSTRSRFRRAPRSGSPEWT